jgi:hypothetical protein
MPAKPVRQRPIPVRTIRDAMTPSSAPPAESQQRQHTQPQRIPLRLRHIVQRVEKLRQSRRSPLPLETIFTVVARRVVKVRPVRCRMRRRVGRSTITTQRLGRSDYLAAIMSPPLRGRARVGGDNERVHSPHPNPLPEGEGTNVRSTARCRPAVSNLPSNQKLCKPI